MELGNCSAQGFPTKDPAGSTFIGSNGLTYNIYLDSFYIHSLDLVFGKCAEDIVKVMRENFTAGSCESIGYKVPFSNVTFDNEVYQVFSPGNGKDTVAVHQIDYPIRGLCSEAEPTAEEKLTFDTLGFTEGSCARFGYFLFAGILGPWNKPDDLLDEHIYALFATPEEERIVDYEFDMQKWIVDWKRPTTDLPHSPRLSGVELDESTRVAFILVNGQYPSPTIECVEGDTINVHVKNNMKDENTALHWHGIHQRGTPFMDGASHITQLPIAPLSTFNYTFKADPAGTYFYHTHNLGFQRRKGGEGAMIIHKRNDPYRDLYDADMVNQDRLMNIM